ncbi:MAG: Ig-like domain-containing protein [Bacilli bacterium]|nr:Ig-like domain-containing protein [Bacilli bacterium]
MGRRRKLKLKKTVKLFFFLFIVFCVLSLAVYMSIKSKVITALIYEDSIKIAIDKVMDENNLHTVTVTYEDDDTVKCSIDDKEYIDIQDCTFKLAEGTHKIYIKNNAIKGSKEFEVKNEVIGTFSSPLDNVEAYYLALGGNKKIEFTFDYPDNFDKTVNYKVDDESIISLNGNTMKGLKVGETNITATLRDGNSKTYKVIVTDLIQPATYNNNKPYLPCGVYTEEQAHTLDKILESRVKEAGEGTRGGTIAAARFLTLEFKYMIRYFNENGRLVTHNRRPYVDAEGRYYHKGLYLSKDKFNDLYKKSNGQPATKQGPAIWGCNLYDEFISRQNQNGLTCSGFVSWAMYNGGFDVGDVGSGEHSDLDGEMSDLGPWHNLTTSYMKGNTYKVGDFIGRDGHAALIIGIDEKNIYTAESLPPKLMAYTYERYNGIVNDPNLTYVIEMDDIYPNGQGWYTEMW